MKEHGLIGNLNIKMWKYAGTELHPVLNLGIFPMCDDLVK